MENKNKKYLDSDNYPKYDINKEGNFAATINGKNYEIIYRDDMSQMYDLFQNGNKIASDKSIRDLMSFDKYAKGGGVGNAISSMFSKTKEMTNKKIHDSKKKIALNVINDTKDKVTSNKQKLILKGAEEFVEKKYAKGGGVGAWNYEIGGL
jgi:hypothetical protein